MPEMQRIIRAHFYGFRAGLPFSSERKKGQAVAEKYFKPIIIDCSPYSGL